MVWNRILFYEEVPERPPLLLRTLLPAPVRTEGGKTRVGATIRCTYRGGDLLKRITVFDPPHRVEFEVIEQALGVESCVLALGGSYTIVPCGNGIDVALCTHYRAYLHPRHLWRRLESLLVHQLHRHILSGIREAIRPMDSARRPCVTKSPTAHRTAPRGLACTPSPSRSHR